MDYAFYSLCKEYGVRNIVAQLPTDPVLAFPLLFNMGFKHNNRNEVGLFTIGEDNYVVADNYKVEFFPTSMRYGRERFYISDFDHLWKMGQVRLFVIVPGEVEDQYVRMHHPEAEDLGDWGNFDHIQTQPMFSMLEKEFDDSYLSGV